MVIRHNQISGNQSFDWGRCKYSVFCCYYCCCKLHTIYHFTPTTLDTGWKVLCTAPLELHVILSGMSLYLLFHHEQWFA
jgi:hypothetical protein